MLLVLSGENSDEETDHSKDRSIPSNVEKWRGRADFKSFFKIKLNDKKTQECHSKLTNFDPKN